MPFIAVLVPLAYQLQGAYQLRRGRSRVDDFFVLFIGTVVAVVLGVVTTLDFGAYHASPDLRARGRLRSLAHRLGAVPGGSTVTLTFGLREARARAARAALEGGHRPQAHSHCRSRRPRPRGGREDPAARRAGLSDRRLRRRPRRRRPPRLSRGFRCWARSPKSPDIIRTRSASTTSTWRCRIDEHAKLLDLIDSASREMRRRQGRARPPAVPRAARAASRNSTACRSSTSTTCRCRASECL